MTTTEIIALIAALGLGGALPGAIRGAWKWLTGRQARERDALREADAELEAARDRITAARLEASGWQDAYYTLRSYVVARGITPPPDLPTTIIEPPSGTH